eukprot:m.193993 g.193993  ORF g.193993 m.193993 type:complete len:94 (+) comp53689_c0_seq6:714-995(+)
MLLCFALQAARGPAAAAARLCLLWWYEMNAPKRNDRLYDKATQSSAVRVQNETRTSPGCCGSARAAICVLLVFASSGQRSALLLPAASAPLCR